MHVPALHEATGTCQRQLILISTEVAIQASCVRSRPTICLLCLSPFQALVANKCRLLVTDQTGNGQTFKLVAVIEIPIHLGVGNDLGQSLDRTIEKFEELRMPIERGERHEQCPRGVRRVRQVQSTILRSSRVILVHFDVSDTLTAGPGIELT